MMMRKFTGKRGEVGFSLVELIIAMTITLVVLTIATTLIAQSLNIRTRGNDNVDALADAERALNIMSREIAQAGFNLMATDNGIVPEDSVIDANGNSTIRIRANLNRFDTTVSGWARNGIGDPNAAPGEDEREDIKYFVYPDARTTLLARYDRFAVNPDTGNLGYSAVLANRLDRLRVHYFAQRVTYNTPPATNTNLANCDITGASAVEVLPVAAKYVVIAVCVRQQATGAPGSPGYQPEHLLLLTSDVALRNANLTNY
jgi:type II secretory pathway component PulJ